MKRHPPPGFTLIEMLLYVSISAVLLLSVTVLFQSLLDARVKNQAVAEVEQQGLQVMQIINQTVRNAAYIQSPATGTSAATLSVATSTASQTVFDVAADTLRITEGVATPVSLTNAYVEASGFSAFNLSTSTSPGTVRVEFTLTHVNTEGQNRNDVSRVFTGSASLRSP